MKYLLPLALLLSSNFAFAKISKVYDTQLQKFVSYDSFIQGLTPRGYVIMGEFHNDSLIQTAQAKIMLDKVQHEELTGNVNIFWEFLNFAQQKRITTEYIKLVTGSISSLEFVTKTAGKQNSSYAPIFDTAVKTRAAVYGANVSRTTKKQLMDGGVDSLDPKLVPPIFDLGSADYSERFATAMGGHATPEMVKKYFMAQSFTDSVMAWRLVKESFRQLSFLVVGSFHSDFFDGTVTQLRKLTPNSISTLKFINTNSLKTEETKEFKQGHPKYGQYADYIILVD